MLVYFVTAKHRYTMDAFLDTWGASLKPHVRVTPYEDAATVSFRGVTTVIFSDYDRLADDQRAGFGALRDELESRRIRVLNHPQHSLRRTELLAVLHQQGINAHRAYRGDQLPQGEALKQLKFPVFARFANEHSGPQSPLLHEPQDLGKTIEAGKKKGFEPKEMLFVEFCETIGSDRLYRKYSAFYIDGVLVPRCVNASKAWSVRVPDIVSPTVLQQEALYLHANPHAEALSRVFQLAKIDYGRIDYAVMEGKLRVWEINPNPYVLLRPEQYKPEHQSNQRWFATRIVPVFERLLQPKR